MKTHEPKNYNITFVCKNGKKFGCDLSTIKEKMTINKEITAFLNNENIVSITIKKGWSSDQKK